MNLRISTIFQKSILRIGKTLIMTRLVQKL